MKAKTLESREPKIVIALGLLLAVISSLPYLFGHLNCPTDGRFLWMTFNIDDFCVYLSWTRQVADGHILMKNLFTNDPQPAMQFNLFFASAGLLSKITGFTPVAVLHILRIILTVLVLWGIWKLSNLFFADARERLMVAALAAFSSGFGWMFSDMVPDRGYIPVDRWQPESLLFLSAYLNPLFLISLLLITGAVYYLVRTHRSGNIRHALLAGMCLSILANVHTYDLVPLAVGWGTYLVILAILRDRRAKRTILLSLLAGVMALPTLLYQVHVYRIDDVYRMRANTPATSPALWAYFLGFGIVFILAVAGVWLAAKRKDRALLICWSAACFATAYLPFVAQQRKFIMGVQIPLVMLAVVSFSWLLRRLSWRNWAAWTVLLVVAASATNTVFIRRDVHMMAENKTAPKLRPFISKHEWRALQWVRNNVGSNESVLCGTDPAAFIPAFAGRHVYLGHWSETPDYSVRLQNWIDFISPETSDQWRREMLEQCRVEYVWYYDSTALESDDSPEPDMLLNLNGRPFLTEVHRDGPVVIYRVKLNDS